MTSKLNNTPQNLKELRNLAVNDEAIKIARFDSKKYENRMTELEARILRLEYIIAELRNGPNRSAVVPVNPPAYGPALPLAPMRPLF